MTFDDNNTSNIDVVILCGGLGKRLKSVISDKPKVLAKIGDITFLDILINNLSLYEFKNIILCTGYLKGHVKKYFEYYHKNSDYNIIFSEEEIPLGTGGAIKNAESLIKSEQFIVMNGDSICDINYNDFIKFHIKFDSTLTILLSNKTQQNNQDYGHVKLDKSQKIISFNEKMSNEKETYDKSLINGGIYLMKRKIFYYMPNTKNFSLEYDLFPKIIDDETVRCYGFITSNEVIDIGTPERYKKAIDLLSTTII